MLLQKTIILLLLDTHSSFIRFTENHFTVYELIQTNLTFGGARVAQWWERSPPTNVARVRILASTPYVGWVCCWFSPLHREVFLRVLRFSALLKNQPFQIPIRSGTHGHVSASSYELLSDPWGNKLQQITITTTIDMSVNTRLNPWYNSICY